MNVEMQEGSGKSASREAGSRRRCCLAAVALALILSASVQAADTFNSAYISEFLAENRQGLKDDDGDYPGWIELCNGSSDAVNLAGWFLTDTATNLTKWCFPRVWLLPGNYLIVFASAKARTLIT